MMVKQESFWVVVITLAAIMVFLNSAPGDFVYDDQRQIVANPLIQDGSLVGKALTSDVWAFKGDGSIAASNYWRPVFTAWCILNFRLFGVDPFGWHLLNILLHTGVCIVGFFLLRRWNVSPLIASAMVLIFAVHPVHTESVAWISGSPDTLFALFFLLSLLFADMSTTGDKARNLAFSLLFYLLALGSKEIAIFCSPVYVFILGNRGDDTPALEASVDQKGWRSASPFLAAAVIYFLVRIVVLGTVSRPVENAAGVSSAILTAPSVFLFYVRQIVFPLWLGPNYSLRPVESVGLMNFFVPLLGSAVLIVGLLFAARRSFVRRIAAALFILPLLPAFMITAFPADQIVHDRYLYMSVFGFVILVFSFVAEYGTKRWSPAAEKYIFGASLLIVSVLATQTYSYNRVWLNDISLWRHAVTIDDMSSTNWRQLGAELVELNDMNAAGDAYRRSLQIRQDPLALMGSSRVAIAKGDFAAAVRDLEKIINMPPESLNAYTLYQSYESLAVAHQQQRNYSAAESRLREARDRLPIYHAALTEKLAVILYLQNRKPEALAELESVRSQARTEMLIASKSVFLRLGMLYSELGRKAEARTALEEFLASTANVRDKAELADRRMAAELLRNLR